MLTLAHVTKSFGANRAVDDVSLAIGRGEIVGIVGENGAGKTTLMRLIAGELRADAGSVTLDGSAAFVHQHFMLVNAFSIAENLALAARPPRRLFRTTRAVELEAERKIAASGIALSGVSRVSGDLSVGEKSKLELIKAIAAHPDLLILDEPTSVLTPFESDELFEVIRHVAASGTAVAFISHKLREVLAIAHRIVVMRQGRVVVESLASAMTADQLATAMVATAAHDPAPSARHGARGAAVITARGLRGERITGATFEVARGEIVAIVGVAGNGQAELASMVAGLSRPSGGSLTVDAGRVASIPEDRTRDGVVAEMTIAENLALTGWRWSARVAAERARELIGLYSIRAQSPHQAAGSLSGGNQQKVVLARELDAHPDAVVAAEPTRGLDLESTRFIHRQLRAAAARGAGILLLTSDLDEAFAVADAIYVIYRGALSEKLTPEMARTRVAPLMAGIA